MFDDILKLIKVALLGAFIWVICSLITTTSAVVAGLPKQFDYQAEETRKALGDKLDSAIDAALFTATQQVGDARKSAVQEVRATRKELLLQVASVRSDLDVTVKQGLMLADSHATKLERELGDTNAILRATATPIAGLVGQVNAAAPDFLDCDHNPNCIFNRYVGFSRASERSMIAVEKALPILTFEAEQTGQHVSRIAGSVDLFVERVTKPQPLWKSVLGTVSAVGSAGRVFMP